MQSAIVGLPSSESPRNRSRAKKQAQRQSRFRRMVNGQAMRKGTSLRGLLAVEPETVLFI